MVLFVECLICHKELVYLNGDPSELIKHMRSEHFKENKSVRDKSQQFDQILESALGRNSNLFHSVFDKSIQTEMERGNLILKYFYKIIKIYFTQLVNPQESQKKSQIQAQLQQKLRKIMMSTK
jgi:hypothetical protein